LRLKTLSRDTFGDLYHGLITMSWPAFIAGIAVLVVLLNGLFALAYMAEPGSIVHAPKGSWSAAFFFSVQTMATIGYGIMYPGTLYGNILMSIETFIGLFGLAFATGLALARFSRPRARIRFSAHAVVTAFHGKPTLMFRIANQRGNHILEAHVQVTLMRNENSPEGHDMRRFHNLTLVRETTPSFRYSWTVMHPITPESPLFESSLRGLSENDAELIVILAGLDETLSQTIHARHVYTADAIHWHHRLRDVLSKDEHGHTLIDYPHFDDMEPDTPKEEP